MSSSSEDLVNLVSPVSSSLSEGGRRRWRSLRKDLVRAVPDSLVALGLSCIIFAVETSRFHAGTNAAVIEMPTMVQTGGLWPYTASQAIGWAALLWSWVTILLGVSLPVWTRQGRPKFREVAERLHRSTSLTVVGLIVAHAVLLIWDKMGDTLVTVFVPWTTSYVAGRFPETLGILSFYLAVLVGLSFYLRDKVGPRLWRVLHRYLIPAVYVLAVWHTFLYGSDVRAHNLLWVTVWILQIPIFAAFCLRLPFRSWQKRHSHSHL